jgi:hypothetical protein
VHPITDITDVEKQDFFSVHFMESFLFQQKASDLRPIFKMRMQIIDMVDVQFLHDTFSFSVDKEERASFIFLFSNLFNFGVRCNHQVGRTELNLRTAFSPGYEHALFIKDMMRQIGRKSLFHPDRRTAAPDIPGGRFQILQRQHFDPFITADFCKSLQVQFVLRRDDPNDNTCLIADRYNGFVDRAGIRLIFSRMDSASRWSSDQAYSWTV